MIAPGGIRSWPALRVALKSHATLQRLLRHIAEGADELSDGINSGSLAPVEWHNEMVDVLRVGYVAAYMDARGETTLSPGAEKLIGRLVGKQVDYLNKFLDEVERDGWNDATMRPRARMYAASVRQAYERGATFGLPLPYVPGSGATKCLTNCRCRLRIKWLDEEELDADVYWELGAAEHCDDCVRLSRAWNPLRVRGGEIV